MNARTSDPGRKARKLKAAEPVQLDIEAAIAAAPATKSKLHLAALSWAAAGFACFPVLPGRKEPACPNGHKDATTDPKQIDIWWTGNPNYNVGCTPAVGGNSVLDVDPPQGFETLALLESEHGKLPPSLTISTPRGGIHWWGDGVCATSASKLGPKLDTRSQGGYVLMPPSVIGQNQYANNPSGGSYTVRTNADIAELPAWITASLTAERSHIVAGTDNLDLPANIGRFRRVLEQYVASGDVAIEGAGGDDRTFRLTCESLDFALSDEVALGLIAEIWNPACEPPWSMEELQTKLDNAAKYRQNEIGAYAVKDAAKAWPEYLGRQDDTEAKGEQPKAEEKNEGAQGRTGIDAVNLDYAVVRHGGEIMIVHFDRDPQTKFLRHNFLTTASFKLWFQNVNEGVHNLGKLWLANAGRRQYSDMAFVPGMVTKPGGVLNLYQGWNVTPRAGDWSLLQAHILDNICQGKDDLNTYVLGWMASAVRNLNRPLGVALALRGGQGTGKGFLAQAFGHLFGPHFLHVSRSEQIVGRFNRVLLDALLVFADEAFYAGDKQAAGALKTLVTEKQILIEAKFRDGFMKPNTVRLLLATNHEWVAPTDHDDRRFAVLDVSEAKKNDGAYFAAIQAQLDAGGYEAMLFDLLARDLSKFEIRKLPDTAARAEQKTFSLSGPEGWLYDVLQAGAIGDKEWDPTGLTVGKAAAYERYRDWAKDRRDHQVVGDALWAKKIRKALGACIVRADTRQRIEGVLGPRQLVLDGSLKDCRAAFSKRMGTDEIVWEDIPQ